MQVRAERGELRITRETFAEHFDGWLKGHHRASKATRDGYRAAGERRLRPYFGPMRLSAIDVQVVRNFAAEIVELVEAGELAPEDSQQHAQLPEHVPQGRRRAAQDPGIPCARRFR
jgi:Phage integrase, N-terminal SAM-like domain